MRHILAIALFGLLLGGRVWTCTWVPDPLRAQQVHFVTCEWRDIAFNWIGDIT